jgi:hypothetical protein
MKLAIMQPYFLPYIGYFQLIAAVDLFVVYDRIKYTKKGWINRNRMLVNGSDTMFSLPLKRDSDALDVVDRAIAAEFHPDKLCQQIRGAYRGAPCFDATFPLIEKILRHPETNLFRFIHHSLTTLCRHLGIGTEIRISSTIPIADGLKSQDKVLALCKAVHASTYINPIGGTELYGSAAFLQNGVALMFLRPMPLTYAQFDHAFVPWLSILDVLMFNPLDVVRQHLTTKFELTQGPS